MPKGLADAGWSTKKVISLFTQVELSEVPRDNGQIKPSPQIILCLPE
jgi:hypothetical protein